MPKTLQELTHSNLTRASWQDILEIVEGSTIDSQVHADLEVIDNYLSAFVPPSPHCIMCGEPLGGLLGSFRWGLVNGEGACGRCGYPARALHRDFGPVKFLEAILQYHPETLEVANA